MAAAAPPFSLRISHLSTSYHYIMCRMTPVQMLFMGLLLLLILSQRGFLTDPIAFVLFIVAIVVAITVHEANHALVAVRLGDPTPRNDGRLSLNPIRHLDPIGTLMLLVAQFGWGRPVVFNPYNLRIDPALGSALVSAAGPVANLVAAFIGARLLLATGNASPEWAALLNAIVFINIVLALFNLLPIPPLDGFGVLMGVAPKPVAAALAPLRTWGMLILVAIVLLPFAGGPSILGQVLLPAVQYIRLLMLG